MRLTPAKKFSQFSGGAMRCFFCYILLLVISVALFGSSFAVTEVNTVALQFNSIGRYYNKEYIFRPGRYFLGLGNKFVPFPTTWQSISLCDGCPSGPILTQPARAGANPVTAFLDVHVFYKLKLKQLPQLIDRYPRQDYADQYSTVIKNAVISTVQKGVYLDDLLSDRERVVRLVALHITQEMQKFHAHVQAVYIGKVKLDSSIDATFLNTWTQTRQQMTSTKQGEIARVVAETSKLRSIREAEVLTMRSGLELWAAQTIAKAQGEGDELLLRAEAESYKKVQERLGLSQDELNRYIYINQMADSKQTMVVGMEGLSEKRTQMMGAGFAR